MIVLMFITRNYSTTAYKTTYEDTKDTINRVSFNRDSTKIMVDKFYRSTISTTSTIGTINSTIPRSTTTNSTSANLQNQ